MFKSKCKENNNKDLLWETDGYPEGVWELDHVA
jgi:hypothetical protein